MLGTDLPHWGRLECLLYSINRPVRGLHLLFSHEAKDGYGELLTLAFQRVIA